MSANKPKNDLASFFTHYLHIAPDRVMPKVPEKLLLGNKHYLTVWYSGYIAFWWEDALSYGWEITPSFQGEEFFASTCQKDHSLVQLRIPGIGVGVVIPLSKRLCTGCWLVKDNHESHPQLWLVAIQWSDVFMWSRCPNSYAAIIRSVVHDICVIPSSPTIGVLTTMVWN